MRDDERYTASMDPKKARKIRANIMFLCQTKMTINAIKNVVTSITVMHAMPGKHRKLVLRLPVHENVGKIFFYKKTTDKKELEACKSIKSSP